MAQESSRRLILILTEMKQKRIPEKFSQREQEKTNVLWLLEKNRYREAA